MAVRDGVSRDVEPEKAPPRFFTRVHARLHTNPVTGLFTKVVVTMIGVAVLVAGLIMMVTPGPGIVGIIVGLGILATEWDWADRLVQSVKHRARRAAESARGMDPAVRRRRLLLTIGSTVVVGVALVTYLALYDWPSFAVTGWDWVQGLSPVVPELPGM